MDPKSIIATIPGVKYDAISLNVVLSLKTKSVLHKKQVYVMQIKILIVEKVATQEISVLEVFK